MIRTDHAALSWLRRTPEPMPQLAHWLTFFEEFDYEVVHREGKRHSNADGLSRRGESVVTVELDKKSESQFSSSDSDEKDQELAVRNISSPSDETAEGMATFSVRENLPKSWIDTETTPVGDDEKTANSDAIQLSRIDDSDEKNDTGRASCKPEEEDFLLKDQVTPAYAVDEGPQRERPRRKVRTPARLKEFVRKANGRRMSEQ